MNKVVCDLCGTSYAETATQCPICGCVRPAEAVAVSSGQDSSGYTHIRGGRFSKANVKKKNKNVSTPAQVGGSSDNNKKIVGFVIVLITLIVIISFMLTMILITLKQRNDTNSTPTTTGSDANCTDLELSHTSIKLTQAGQVWMLEAIVSPVECVDTVYFHSSDDGVCTVSEAGIITCIAEGTATITVNCGDQTATCAIVCKFPEETTLPTVAPEGIHLNRMSITADIKGFSWQLYSGDIPVSDIVWTSDDPAVATFVDGVVEAISEGKTMVHADYNGIRTSCEIICDFDTVADNPYGDQEGETTVSYTLYTNYNTTPKYNDDLKAYDITLSMKEGPVSVFLKDSTGKRIDLVWSIVSGDSCVVDGTTVKVISSESNCKIMAEYDGVVYYCFIRTVN